jgi:DNA mismatch endonuclease (patch repair protein)
VVLPRYKALVYIHGCFWHRHEGCRFASTPCSNIEKWQKKFQENTTRDQKNREKALQLGWKAVVVWECETRDLKSLAFRLGSLLGLQDIGGEQRAGD